MADPNPMLAHLTPEQRRRMGNAMMAAQYAENPPQAEPGYDWNAASLSPELMNFAAQRGQPGVIQKTLGLIPGFDQDGARGRQSWGNAMMSTAQFPIDAVAGIGQALTAPARAYRGEFDPTSEEGVGEALNVAGNAMMGGLAAPRPANSVGALSSRIQKQIHEAQVAANPGVDPNKLAQITRHGNGFIEVSSPAGNIDAGPARGGVRVYGSDLDDPSLIGTGYGKPLYDKLADYVAGSGQELQSGYSVSPKAQGMWEGHLSKSYPVERSPVAFHDTSYGAPEGTLITPQASSPVYTIGAQQPQRPLPPPLPDNVMLAHGTTKNFENLDPAKVNGLGVNFGTIEQAQAFGGNARFSIDGSRIIPATADENLRTMKVHPGIGDDGSALTALEYLNPARKSDPKQYGFDQQFGKFDYLSPEQYESIKRRVSDSIGFDPSSNWPRDVDHGTINKVANDAARNWFNENGIGGFRFNNVHAEGPGETLMVWQSGAMKSPYSGDALFSNGGRPGAATGAALNVPDDSSLAEILRKYGLLDQPNPMLSRPASPQYRSGDA